MYLSPLMSVEHQDKADGLNQFGHSCLITDVAERLHSSVFSWLTSIAFMAAKHMFSFCLMMGFHCPGMIEMDLGNAFALVEPKRTPRDAPSQPLFCSSSM